MSQVLKKFLQDNVRQIRVESEHPWTDTISLVTHLHSQGEKMELSSSEH